MSVPQGHGDSYVPRGVVRGGVKGITRVVGEVWGGWRALVLSACVSGTPFCVPQGHGDSYVPRGVVRGGARGGVRGWRA